MESEATLDDLLSGNAEPVETQEAAAEPNNGIARDEHGRFAPREAGETAEQPMEGPPPSEPEPQHIPLNALQDERRKRQHAEDQLNQMQSALQQYESYFQQANQPTPEDDPIAYVAQQVRDQLAPQLQQELLVQKVTFAEMQARARWNDYDDKVEMFKAEAQRNPFLLQQAAAAPDPAAYAYNVATQIDQARQWGGNPAPSLEQIEAELREKIIAELGISNRQAPLSTATERSTGTRSGPAWSGPATLDELLRR